MQCPLEKMNRQTLQVVKAVGRSADKKGIKAFLVGGMVRDLFLKRENVDIDIVVQGDAVAFAQDLASGNGLALKTHKRFGTATLSEWKGRHVDVVTARSERYPSPGSLPVVQKASLKEDVFRRDFTINALAVCVNRDGFGQLVDLCQGWKDLQKGIIRVFHDKSFLDDPTRLLRAVRFEQRFGFRLERKTLRLLKQAVERKAYQTVSAPRYFQEFARGLTEDAPGRYLKRLKALGALAFLNRQADFSVSAVLRLDSLIAQQRKMFRQNPGEQKLLYLAALYAGVTEKDLLEDGKKFQWLRAEKQRLLETVKAKYKNMRPSDDLVV